MVAKGDLTSGGTEEEYEAFLRSLPLGFRRAPPLGRWQPRRAACRRTPREEVVLNGATLAILDTRDPRPGRGAGQRRAAGVAGRVAAGRADRPVLVFGHHHALEPGVPQPPGHLFRHQPDDSEPLVAVVARRPAWSATSPATPTATGSAVRGHRGGPLGGGGLRQGLPGDVGRVPDLRGWDPAGPPPHRRARRLGWSERCRSMLAGLYPHYAFGQTAVPLYRSGRVVFPICGQPVGTRGDARRRLGTRGDQEAVGAIRWAARSATSAMIAGRSKSFGV